MDAHEMLETTKLNWNVKSETLTTSSGLIVPNKVAIVREDNNAVLGVHSDNYVPYQNLELMELLYNISQSTGLQLHSSGLFNDGGKVWIQLKSDDLKLGNDKIEGYLSGINSFDGSTSLSFGNANLTISCQNTFWRGYRMLQSKFRHSSSMKVRIDEILRGLDVLLKEEQDVFKQIVKMSETRATPITIESVTKKLFNITDDELHHRDQLSTRKQNMLTRFDMDLQTELKGKEDSLWGLFSGVTRYTTHSATNNTERNKENKMFGHTGVLERQLFHELYAVA